jgi:hypothetical protein
MQNATWLFIAVISIRQISKIRSRLIIRCVNGDKNVQGFYNFLSVSLVFITTYRNKAIIKYL